MEAKEINPNLVIYSLLYTVFILFCYSLNFWTFIFLKFLLYCAFLADAADSAYDTSSRKKFHKMWYMRVTTTSL